MTNERMICIEKMDVTLVSPLRHYTAVPQSPSAVPTVIPSLTEDWIKRERRTQTYGYEVSDRLCFLYLLFRVNG